MIWWTWLVLASAAPDAGALETTWRAARDDATWRSPTRAERTAVQEGVRLLALAAPTCDPAGQARAVGVLGQAGLVVQELDGLWVVAEGEERRGAGWLVLRCGEATAQVLQAPHARYDRGTGALALQLFAEGTSRAVQLNTVHRYRAVAGEVPQDPVHPADVAHQPGSLFHAATLGLAASDPALRVVQVHGFAEGRVAADAVVSSADAERPARGVAERSSPLGTVALFGPDTDELGATTNAQGVALPGRFLHVELSPGLRERLAASAELRLVLLAAVEGAWW